MRHASRKPWKKASTWLLVVAPSAILIVGLSVVGMLAFMLGARAFEPNWIILIGGMIIVLTTALAVVLFLGPPADEEDSSGRPQ